MKKIISFMLALLLICTMFTACGSTDSKETDAKNDNSNMAVFGLWTEPILDWDPSVMYSNGNIVLHNIYETLLKFNTETKEYEKVLASDYLVSEDGLTWTFKIREGVKFHDGTYLNAEAVKFSYERTRDLGQGAAYMFEPIEKITVKDDYTLEITLKNVIPLDLIVSANYGAFIFSPTAVKNNPENWFMDGNEAGTGPYVLEKNEMGSQVVLTAFNDYWKGWDEKKFKTIVIKKISETSSRRQMVEQGEIDITSKLPVEDLEALNNNENIVIKEQASLENLMIHYNTENNVLSNSKLREALSYAFPYNDVIKHALGGHAKQGVGPIPYVHWGHGEELFQYQQNLDKAKELLTEAGYPDGGIKLLYTYMSGDEAERKIGELYKVALQKINIELEVRGMTWDSQWEMSKHVDPEERQDLYIMYHSPDYASPFAWFKIYFMSEDEILFNLSYYKNRKFDNLVEKAETYSGVDINKAENMFIDAQKMLIEDNTTIYVADLTEAWVVNKQIKGFEINPLYSNVVNFYNLYKE